MQAPRTKSPIQNPTTTNNLPLVIYMTRQAQAAYQVNLAQSQWP